MERDDQLYTDPNMHGCADLGWSVDIESLLVYPVVYIITNGVLSYMQEVDCRLLSPW